VSATDVRSATKEQILSLGAKPIFVENVKGIEGEGAGGYATEMSDEYKAAQAELVSAHIARQDIVITTALIPGRPAPRLISDAQLATMRPGSVVVDLAVEQGGNVEGSAPGEVTARHGVKIVGHRNVPSRLPAGRLGTLFAQPLQLPQRLLGQGSRAAGAADDDEIVKGVRLTRADGKCGLHERLARLMGFFSASEIRVEDVQRDYAPILVPGEQVVAAFKTIRDVVFLTNFRLALVDVQGLTGRKFEVVTIPTGRSRGSASRRRGSFDLDADLKVWVTGDPVPLEVKISRKVDPAGSSRSWRAACSGECRQMDFIAILSIFVLACFVGYFVVWAVTPACTRR
jgi:hypothetical protein